VEQPVLRVRRQVENRDPRRKRRKGGHVNAIEKAPPLRGAVRRPCDADDRKDRPDCDVAENRDADVAPPSQKERGARLTTRHDPLEQRHGDDDREEGFRVRDRRVLQKIVLGLIEWVTGSVLAAVQAGP
jgi:hypothetical protein